MIARARSIAVLVALLAGSDAGAFRVTLDATLLGDSGAANYVSIPICGVTISIASANDVIEVGAGGIGLRGGGPNDTQIDGGEALNFSLQAAAFDVAYQVSSASNADGDALFGETFVRAHDGVNQIGIEPVSGVGTIDLAAVFGGTPIRGFTITSAPDGVRIGRISYEAPRAPVSMPLGRLSGSHTAAEIVYCGITFRGEPGLPHLGADGMAVSGGAANSWIDPGEALEVDFGEPIAGLRYELDATEVVNPGSFGGHFVEAFDAAGSSLGIRSASASDWVDLAAAPFYGGTPISRFQLIATGDQIRLRRVEMAPEAAGAGIAAITALVSWRGGRRRQRPARARTARA